jgi:hypothetical protein
MNKIIMSRILSLGKTCKSYLREYRDKRPNLSFHCQNRDCHHQELYQHGRYFRLAVTKDQVFQIPIYRWCCPTCGKTLAVLPDFMVPYVHFVTTVREEAIHRKQQGMSNERIAEGVVVSSVHVSPCTIKRWWKRHLDRVDERAQWVAGQLIRAGVNEDLLHLHSKGVNPSLMDTVHWFQRLLEKYSQYCQFNPSPMGYFCFLNTRLPGNKWI